MSLKPVVIFLGFVNLALAQTPTPTPSPPKIFVDGESDFLNNGAFVFCSSVDDGLPKALTYNWTKVSGPGSVTWGAQQRPMTHVRFSVKGLYVLKCTVTDGQSSVSDQISILADQYADLACRP
jgi:hypothetical protein